MKKLQRISDSEKQIMEYIWAAGRPVTTSEIIRHLPEEKSWKQNTVVTFLARLMEKGVLPCVTEQEYRNFETKQFIKDVHKGSVLGFINALCDNGDLTKQDIESLMKRLRE